MHSIREIIHLSTRFLEKKGVNSPRLCAEELLAFVLKRKRIDLFIDYDALLETEQIDAYRFLIQRKGCREPLGYLLEKVEFLNCSLTLSPDVLIPRQETEILMNLALKDISNDSKVLWDICTGSGCMGLSAKKHRPNLEVTLSDLSEQSLVCAKKNGEDNGLQVSFLKGDLTEPFRGKKADYVLCNPPYVSEEEYLNLEREIYFEPKSALVAKEGGLEFYKRLASELPPLLNSGARVFLEIGHNQGDQILSIFHESHWKQKRYERDWSGKDRFFFLEFSSQLP